MCLGVGKKAEPTLIVRARRSKALSGGDQIVIIYKQKSSVQLSNHDF